MRVRYLPIRVTVKLQTEKAVLGTFAYEDCMYVDKFIPLSQVHDTDLAEVDEAFEGDTIELNISEWWLNQQ